VEGFGYDKTLEELDILYPPAQATEEDDEEEVMGDTEKGDEGGIPESIRSMIDSRHAIEALGSMIWCVIVSFTTIVFEH